ncbi:hypothetical protein DQ04_25501000 [Trypanosoma grayi]|uniref:hypothetical protein n=1 Tax=Trypanosoma grayi TaxID=71804 RepID=UPI0004F44DC4|nr:hypothetical protein DQ04_25501000 [Trypanosoma grayi]KEG05211.1 hypothetical protein DQ04_25501000 [Trypanosoma grayi]
MCIRDVQLDTQRSSCTGFHAKRCPHRMGIVSHQENNSIQRRKESHTVSVALQRRDRKLSTQYVLSAIPLHEPLHVDRPPTLIAAAESPL